MKGECGDNPMMQAIATFLGQLTTVERLLLSVGLVVVVVGVVMLGRIRKAATRGDGPSQNGGQESEDVDAVRHDWVLTRTAAGYATVVVGYHLIVWALPPGLTDLCVPLRLWFVLPAACAAAVGGAWAMERNGL